MNREIKFRAWHPGHAGADIQPEMFYPTKSYHALQWKAMGQPVEIMQFTGLKDKNGVDIYEGDIVEVDYSYRSSPYVDKLLCKFTNGSFNFFYKGIERVVNVDTTVYSVIGNIYQNPELLK